MSLASSVGSKLGLYRYDRGAVILSADVIRPIIEDHPLFEEADVYLKDGDYLGLADDRIEVFLADRVWTPGRRYRPERFDCDDFAAVARGQILDAGDRLDFARAVFAAELCHWPPAGDYHDAILLVSASRTLYVFEPQTGKLTKDLSSVIRKAGEVWG